jgi:hypothetical protein
MVEIYRLDILQKSPCARAAFVRVKAVGQVIHGAFQPAFPPRKPTHKKLIKSDLIDTHGDVIARSYPCLRLIFSATVRCFERSPLYTYIHTSQHLMNERNTA